MRMSQRQLELLDQLYVLLRQATTNKIVVDKGPIHVANQQGDIIKFLIMSFDEVQTLFRIFRQALESGKEGELDNDQSR